MKINLAIAQRMPQFMIEWLQITIILVISSEFYSHLMEDFFSIFPRKIVAFFFLVFWLHVFMHIHWHHFNVEFGCDFFTQTNKMLM